jgi:hypothetical protein
MGLIFIYGLHVDLVVSRMRADEFDPGDAGPILHFHDHTILVATDIEYNPVVATDAGVTVG